LKANSLSEQENSAMKRDPMGPRPNMAIDRSQMSTEKHEMRRLAAMATGAKHSLTQTQLEDCVVAKDLSTTVNEHGRNDLFQEFNASLDCRRFKSSPGRHCVRRSKWSKVDTNPESDEHWTSVVPRFDRTRIVSVFESESTLSEFKCLWVQMSREPDVQLSKCHMSVAKSLAFISQWKVLLEMHMQEI
jgi:hypothetical protein